MSQGGEAGGGLAATGSSRRLTKPFFFVVRDTSTQRSRTRQQLTIAAARLKS